VIGVPSCKLNNNKLDPNLSAKPNQANPYDSDRNTMEQQAIQGNAHWVKHQEQVMEQQAASSEQQQWWIRTCQV